MLKPMELKDKRKREIYADATSEYSGWTNKETWSCNLMFTNDPPNYNAVQAIVVGSGNLMEKAQKLKEYCERVLDCGVGNTNMIRQQAINDWLLRVNFEEIILFNAEV